MTLTTTGVKMIKTIEELNGVCGFFTKYNEINNTNFQQLFGELSASEIIDLDNLLTDVQGEKLLQKKWNDIFENQNANNAMTRIVKTCNLLHFDGWLKIKNSVLAGLSTDVTKPIDETETIEQSTSDNTENSNTDTNKVFGFDSETASNDTITETSGTNDVTGSLDRTKTVSKSNGKLASENAEKVIDFARYNDFLTIVLADISDVMGLSIY